MRNVLTNSMETLLHIRMVIRNTEVPSWVYGVPAAFGEAKSGTLKADEWRSLTTIYLPLALVILWGIDSNHPNQHSAEVLQNHLDHTMRLVSAIQLALYRHTTSERAEKFAIHMKHYLDDLQVLHPDASRVCNQHMSLHLPMFLKLFGPAYSWWSFVFERLIGRLQRLPSNNTFG